MLDAVTGQMLDAVADRLMHRLAYRNFGNHETLVVNHTADVGGGHARVRWYEFRNPATTPVVFQQSTYAPDSDSRWMGSAAMDHTGNLAVGYSVSGSNTYPSIRYAGRLVSDPLNQLSQGEATLWSGTGSQSGVNRWGDYSALTIDPADDCTFWYTQEYNNNYNWYWKTRIGSFKFPSCSNSPPPTTLTPRVYLPVTFRNSAAPLATPTPFASSTAITSPTTTASWTPTQVSTGVPSSTPTHDPTSTPSPTSTAPGRGWRTLLNETFENNFPGSWDVFDNDSSNHGEYFWGKRTCRPDHGSYSSWAIGAGVDGDNLACGADYPNHVDSWMTYGPFSLANATDGDMTFQMWLNSETTYDKMMWYASVDGYQLYCNWTSGNSGGGSKRNWI